MEVYKSRAVGPSTYNTIKDMPLFICSKCGNIENTALSGYWFKQEEPALCSDCDPKFKEWHGRFPKSWKVDDINDVMVCYVVGCNKRFVPDKKAVTFGTKKWDGHSYKPSCSHYDKDIRLCVG